MHILLTAATDFEIKPVVLQLQQVAFKTGNHQISTLISGIGASPTAYTLTKAICAHRPDYIIQAGIAGSFSTNFLPPQVVFIKEEIMGDVGTQEEETFKDLFDLGLLEASSFPYNNKRLKNPLLENESTYYQLPVANGITVNEISTDISRIELLRQKYQPDIESMEGATLHYIALMEKIPFLQLRAVSNIVGERDKKKWQIKEAITVLNETLLNLLPQLS